LVDVMIAPLNEWFVVAGGSGEIYLRVEIEMKM
jgi:hypothetical protein